MRQSFLYSLSFFLLHAAAVATVIHVPSQHPTIQAGINASIPGDTVLIAGGEYFESINFKGKAITVGSYFLIDGSEDHIANTVINGAKISHPDSASLVYMISGEGKNSILCGLTLINGRGTVISGSLGFPARAGGAVLGFSSGTIRNNIIEANSIENYANGAGAAIFAGLNNRGFFSIENNTIRYNAIRANEQAVGGAIALFHSDGRIANNQISKNRVSIGTHNPTNIVGGAIFCESEPFRINDVLISGNRINDNACFSAEDYFASYGAAIAAWFTRVKIEKNTIRDNYFSETHKAFGAAIALNYCGRGTRVNDNMLLGNSIDSAQDGHGTISVMHSEEVLIERNIIKSNSMRFGAGLIIFESNATQINANTISDNSAGSSGGGIYIVDSWPYITNNLITHNQAQYGAGVKTYSCPQNLLPANAGIDRPKETFAAQSPRPLRRAVSNFVSLINNTICGNRASVSGGGVYARGLNTVLLNSVLWNNTAPLAANIFSADALLRVMFSNIENGWPGHGNQNELPRFIPGSYELSDRSPCLGAGAKKITLAGREFYAPRRDLDDLMRPAPKNSAPDLGACESALGEEDQLDTDLELKFPESPAKAFPNPFNPSTTIAFNLQRANDVSLKIYDLLGKKVTTLVDERLKAGPYHFQWHAGNLAAGVYVYRLTAGNASFSGKITLLE